MPQPSSALSTLRPDLAGALEEFDLVADRAGFIGYQVLPVMDVGHQAGVFGKIPIEQLLKDRSATIKRAPGSGYSRDTFKFESDSYATEEYGHEEVVDDKESRLYAEYIDAEIVATTRAFDAVLREAEKRVAALLYNATTWSGEALTTALSNEWDDFTNATPIDDVAAACQKVWDTTGVWPNALIINNKQFKKLRRCDQITEAVASTGAGESFLQRKITTAQLCQALDIDRILVAGGAKNTANEAATLAIASVWSDEYAMVAKIATSNDIKEPCLGRVFHWGVDGSTIGGTVENYREDRVRGGIVRVRHEVDEKVLYTGLGHLLSNVITI